MKKTIYKILVAIILTISMFLINSRTVFATDIECTYRVYMGNSYVTNSINTFSEIIARSDGTFEYTKTMNDDDRKSDHMDKEFSKKIKKNDCPQYMIRKSSGNISKGSTYNIEYGYQMPANMAVKIAFGEYKDVYYLNIKDGKFMLSKKETIIPDIGYLDCMHTTSDVHFFLYKEVINKDSSGESELTDKGRKVTKKFFEDKIFTNDWYKTINNLYKNLGEYVELANYPEFKDYQAFVTYATGDFNKRSDFDKKMTQEQWNKRINLIAHMRAFEQQEYAVQSTNYYYKDFIEDNETYQNIKKIYIYIKNPNAKEIEENAQQANETYEQTKNDICLYVCSDENGILYEKNTLKSCKDTANGSYQTCSSCLKGDCAGKESSELTSCMDTCWGSGEYSKLLEKDKKIQDAIKAGENLTKVGAIAPSLNIKFDAKNGKIDCEDISTLHTVYMILIIIAPVLVIVLGSLDFAQSVMASNEEKILEFRKKFPKRLILLILLIVIPIVISIILGTFTSLDDSLMYCIVKGS